MSNPEQNPVIIRTARPRWSSGEKRALVGWAVFAIALIVVMVFAAIRIVTSISSAARPPGAKDSSVQGKPRRDGPELQGFTFAPNGVSFAAPPADPTVPPRVQPLTVPEFTGYSAIWGATGRDHRGHVWLGVSTRGQGGAHLMEYDPLTGTIIDRGDAHEQLRNAGLKEPGMSQIKIHSRIEQGPDGWLYFTTMDEQGEKSDGSANPTWGSHLWRIDPTAPGEWEHVTAAPQGLIALTCGGRMVYTLGYHGHVVHQYDTKNGSTRSITLGSVGGHISRNIAVDRRDHVYVPRLRRGGGTAAVSLVELDAMLLEVAATPLEDYMDPAAPAQSHGITGVQPMADGSIVFVTSLGALYRIVPPAAGNNAATVTRLGFFHPKGSRYIASLFTHDGKRHVMGVSQEGQGWEWVCFDLEARTSTVAPLPLEYADGRKVFKHLLYGSITRDSQGAFFLVGTDQNLDRPVVLRLK